MLSLLIIGTILLTATVAVFGKLISKTIYVFEFLLFHNETVIEQAADEWAVRYNANVDIVSKKVEHNIVAIKNEAIYSLALVSE